MQLRHERLISICLAFIAITNVAAGPPDSAKHAMTIDDVLGMEHLDQISISPDSDTIAAVVQRPVKGGEVYGRTAYETDPSRNDVWLISRATHERRNITNGAGLAAGFWCTSWSPDGRRLAMISTRPEGAEPRGGDNVRLYLWDRDTNRLSRLGDVALVTQTRYGSAIHPLDLRGGADKSGITHSCGGENAPFLWLDGHRLLAVTLPEGQVSGLIDQEARPLRIEEQDRQALHDGSRPTGEAMGSGAERMHPADDAAVIIQTVDADTRTWHIVATVPDYPFAGDLSLSVSPDGRRLAVLAPIAAFPPIAGRRIPNAENTDWTIKKRFGIVDLDGGATRWLSMPNDASDPLELLAWSPDGRHVALRARTDAFTEKPILVFSDASSGQTASVPTLVMDQAPAGSISPHEAQFIWIDAHHALARMKGGDDNRLDWWRVTPKGPSANLTGAWPSAPSALRHLPDGRVAAIDGTALVAIEPWTGKTTTIADLHADHGSFAWPADPSLAGARLIVKTSDAHGQQCIQVVDASGADRSTVTIPASANVVALTNGGILWQQGDQTGLFLNETDLAAGRSVSLLSLDAELASIAWGRTIFFDYHTIDGAAVKGAAILPPDYKSGRRYPTLAWVYDGYQVSGVDDYFLDPQMPGFYNLQLYAAQGYVVLIPSMPLPSELERKNVYASLPTGVLPAVDALTALGIADPDRIGVFGQSYGGYSVYGLVSQTDRFKAGVAMAGITDLQGFYEQPDPLARGYPGIAHEKSANWIIADQFGVHEPPTLAHDTYWQNSPLAHAGDVHTPLLLLHGTHDIRGSITQADQFFYALYAQGKTARLVRYDGESHSLAQSPANVRDVFRETVAWFDRYVKAAQ